MRIKGLETIVLQESLGDKSFGWSQGVADRRQTALCLITTDDGLQGVGEAYYYGGPSKIVASLMSDIYGPALIGRDPMDTSVIWDLLYNRTRDQGTKGLPVCALSAVDIALWDIKGKVLGLPIYKLLGGAYRDKALVYATGLFEPQFVPDKKKALIEEALGYKKEGFSAMKLKIGYGIDQDMEYVKAIREAIGYDLKLMVDANRAYTASDAIQLSREMERYKVYWFEEPLPPEDIDGYVEIKAKSSIPIAGGKNEFTRYGFRELIVRRGVDILLPNLCAAGGFTEMMKIVAMASAWNTRLVPYVRSTNVGLAASLQFFGALPHFPDRRYPGEPFFEYDRSPHPLREGVTQEKFVMKNGYLEIPQRPGLGITLEMEFIKKYRVAT